MPRKNGEYFIKSVKDGKALCVCKNYDCRFLTEDTLGGYYWDIEYKDGYYIFISACDDEKFKGNVMKPDEENLCRALNKLRGKEARMIVRPIALTAYKVNIPAKFWKIDAEIANSQGSKVSKMF